MDEYIGPKNLVDEHGNIMPLPEYVAWLELQLTSLKDKLVAANSTISSLRSIPFSTSTYNHKKHWREQMLNDYVLDDDNDRDR